MNLTFPQVSLKMVDSKNESKQLTDSSDTSGLCNLPNFSLAIWPTFSCFTVLTYIYVASSYRGLRHHICSKIFVTVFLIMAFVAAKVSAKKSKRDLLVPTPPVQIQDILP